VQAQAHAHGHRGSRAGTFSIIFHHIPPASLLLQENKDAAKAEMEELTAKKEKEKWRYDKKTTAHDILMQKTKDNEEREEKKKAFLMAQRREMSETDYARLVDVVINNNRGESIDASNIADAINQFDAFGIGRGSSDSPKPTMTFKDYSLAKIEELKVQKPGLKLAQYRDQAWNLWQRDPLNPKNQK